MSSSFETNRYIQNNKKEIVKLQCLINSLGQVLNPVNKPIVPDKEVTRITCCTQDCKKVIVTTTHCFEYEYVLDDPNEEPATSTNSKCGVPSTIAAPPAGNYQVANVTEETVYQEISADGTLTEWLGDPTTLDPTCSLCMECTPLIQDVCLDEGATYINFTKATISSPKGCCTIKVSTSAGDFFLRKGMTQKCIGPFKCPIEITSIDIIDGSCELSDVCIQLEASGCYECGLT